jgi:plasmid stabilization system protein ParE
MHLQYLAEASEDLLCAVTYYKSCEEELATDFYRELLHVETDVIKMPELWRRIDTNYRRKLFKRYPYSLVYRLVDEEIILVVAVAHTSRHPDYWKARI